ncbi:MAG: flagellar export chaperone FliS [Phycisphaerales bacterium]
MTTSPNPYLETKVLTASPEELRLMLLDGAIKFCRQGRDALQAKDFAGCHEGFSRCRAILVELVSSMRTEIDPGLCERLSALYLFMIGQLVESSHARDASKADRVIELLEYDRETWVMLMRKLSEEKQANTDARAAVAPSAEPASPTGERAELSFQA